ncbi:hypothetical protein [Streptomonospora salina]|uniref:Phage tail protein n=1 Tax=Streptomonospora salina TaxID=104205 RepID=A0A841EAR2_9ACTN|nr:hypothetical protein [Streptomonospora salina]MBB6000215.1 hypothetical protein [Streptomonospora salina]
MASDQPIVGANGDIWFGPVGTAKPQVTAEVPADLTKLGLVSEDGVTFGNSRDTTNIPVWQSFYPARRLTTEVENTMAFALATWSRDSVRFAFGGGTWSGDATAGFTYTPPEPGHEAEYAVLMRWLDGDFTGQLWFPRSTLSENEDLTIKKDEAALLGVTVAVLGQVGMPPWQFDSADARFAPPGEPATLAATESSGKRSKAA